MKKPILTGLLIVSTFVLIGSENGQYLNLDKKIALFGALSPKKKNQKRTASMQVKKIIYATTETTSNSSSDSNNDGKNNLTQIK